MPSAYPPLNLAVRTPRLTLAAATDALLERLVPLVRAGVVTDGEPLPFDDPMSLYADGPDREWSWTILHLAFDGLGAREAGSEAFLDNHASNRVSEAVGYRRNGTSWATRKGEPAELLRWRLTREGWLPRRRTDVELAGVRECRPVLGLPIDVENG